MADDELARMLVADLTQYLAEQARSVEGSVYAIELFAEAAYARFAVTLATQASFERRRDAAVYAALSDDEKYGPEFRWYSGEWANVPQEFMSAQTRQALEPLASILLQNPGDEDETARWTDVLRRWYRIGYQVIAGVRVPPELPTTPDMLQFVGIPDMNRAADAHVMLRTVPAERFHEAIPAWRRLAATVRGMRDDDVAMQHVRQQAEEYRARRLRFPYQNEAAPDELTSQLRACGLTWLDVADWTDDLTEALAVADADGDWQPTPANLVRTGE